VFVPATVNTHDMTNIFFLFDEVFSYSLSQSTTTFNVAIKLKGLGASCRMSNPRPFFCEIKVVNGI
jgi:hypothetical protein